MARTALDKLTSRFGEDNERVLALRGLIEEIDAGEDGGGYCVDGDGGGGGGGGDGGGDGGNPAKKMKTGKGKPKGGLKEKVEEQEKESESRSGSMSKEERKQLESILDGYDTVLKETPANLLMRKRRISLLKSLGRDVEVVKALTELLDIWATDAEAWAECAEAYLKLGMFPQAIFCLEDVLLIQPNAWNVGGFFSFD